MSYDSLRSSLSVMVLAGAAMLAGPAAAVSAQQPGLGTEPREGVLLLRNGHVLEGKITRVGDRYHLVVDGGAIQVRTSEVEFCCRDLEEGFLDKKARIQPGSVHDRLELAQWCQRHGLLGHAAEQLAEAMGLDPAHPMIPLVQRRVELSRQQEPSTRPPARPSVEVPSPDDLDRLTQGMPPGSVETFTRTVQPLLLNHCSAAGCHGPGSQSKFSLLRMPSGRPASRRLTQRNLHSTLERIDRDNPAASPLLTAPIRPHGSAPGAIFTDHDLDKYQRIVRWVHRFARFTDSATPASHQQPADAAVPAVPAVHVAPLNSPMGDPPPRLPDGLEADRAPPAAPVDPRLPIPGRDDWLLPEKPRVQRGARLPRFIPVDPFDPEIFNRRFFPSGRPAGG